MTNTVGNGYMLIGQDISQLYDRNSVNKMKYEIRKKSPCATAYLSNDKPNEFNICLTYNINSANISNNSIFINIPEI